MGAWGAGLYSNDTTCDVRDDYIQHLKHGLSHSEACQKVLGRHAARLGEPEVACLVHFALADTAWKYGRLDETLKDKALSLLRAGGDLSVWERDAPGEVPARRKALKALEARLATPQPAEKPVKVSPPKPRKVRTTAPVGSVFSLDLPSQRQVLLVLVGFVELEKSIDPVFSVLAQPIASAESLPIRITGDAPTLVLSKGFRQPFRHVAILPRDERKDILSGLTRLDITVEAAQPFQREHTVWLALGRIASEVDAHL
ncbi:hypothetical protein ACM792_24350 [Metapseudomonas otitidis]|uniref:hypothetical protein n=1 Tax=Metapseudomonas otitidis TaxID=319939 RepID=UPI0039FC8CDC